MGYTHYFETKQELSLDMWNKFLVPAVKHVLDFAQKSGIEIAGSWGDAGTLPEFTDEHLMFNGVGEDAHETMTIFRLPNKFYFCKTARKPYDAVCVAVAVLTKVLFGKEAFNWSSDGDNELGFDQAGKDLLKAALNIKGSNSYLNRSNVLDRICGLHNPEDHGNSRRTQAPKKAKTC